MSDGARGRDTFFPWALGGERSCKNRAYFGIPADYRPWTLVAGCGARCRAPLRCQWSWVQGPSEMAVVLGTGRFGNGCGPGCRVPLRSLWP